MRPETLSLPTRESRFVGDDIAAMTRWFLSAAPPPPVFFSPPPQAARKTRIAIENRRIEKAPSLYKRDAGKAKSKKQKARILAARGRSPPGFLLFAFCFLLCLVLYHAAHAPTFTPCLRSAY